MVLFLGANRYEEHDNEIIFPYILIQSGVKPIISPFEIKNFNKACDALEKADYLIILGYGLNSDDEHITTMIRYCLDTRKDKLKVYNLIHKYNEYFNNDTLCFNNDAFQKEHPIAYEFAAKYSSFKNLDCCELENILKELKSE